MLSEKVQQKSFDRVVPCGTCSLCCKLHTPLTDDEYQNYDWADWWFMNPNGQKEYKGKILWRQQNGDCIYLIDNRCTIYDRRPRACREFDCRETFKHSDRAGRKIAIKRGDMTKEIFERGRELLHQAGELK